MMYKMDDERALGIMLVRGGEEGRNGGWFDRRKQERGGGDDWDLTIIA